MTEMSAWERGSHPRAALEATQGQMDGSLSQLPYKCHLEEVASVGNWLKICPRLDSRVGSDHEEGDDAVE